MDKYDVIPLQIPSRGKFTGKESRPLWPGAEGKEKWEVTGRRGAGGFVKQTQSFSFAR